MADKPFDRQVINQRERPLSSDVNQGWSYGDQALRYLLDNLMRVRATGGDAPLANAPDSGFLGDGFRVTSASPAAMSIIVNDGLGFAVDAAQNASDIGSALTPGVLGVDDNQRMHPLPLSAPQTVAVPASDPVNPRIDIVEVKLDRRLADASSRQVLDPGTGLFSALSVSKTLAYDLDGRTGVNTTGGNSTTGIALKTGTAAGAPVAPATSAGYIKIAEVYVAGASTAVAQNAIRDVRPVVAIDGVRRVSIKGTVTALGNATPTSLAVSGAPGVQAVALFVAGGVQLTSFWLFGGDLASATVTAQASIESSSSAAFNVNDMCYVHAVVVGALTPGDIATISTGYPATVGPTLAEGQTYVRVDVVPNTLNVIAPNNVVLAPLTFSNPHALHLDVTIR